jgi:hypothetical protein
VEIESQHRQLAGCANVAKNGHCFGVMDCSILAFFPSKKALKNRLKRGC